MTGLLGVILTEGVFGGDLLLRPAVLPQAGAKVKISEHMSDVRSFAETVLPGMRPVFISHR